ncbi:hypothetical protein (Partial), partial [Seminavis robusta]|eukprot:Sro2218_g319500.1 n/a (73) ;mRNA; r:12-231
MAMANANAGAAFGWRTCRIVPEAPTEQPKYTGITIVSRQIHELAAQRTYTKAARFQPSALARIQPHTLRLLEW